jgi:hypothetical protein
MGGLMPSAPEGPPPRDYGAIYQGYAGERDRFRREDAARKGASGGTLVSAPDAAVSGGGLEGLRQGADFQELEGLYQREGGQGDIDEWLDTRFGSREQRRPQQQPQSTLLAQQGQEDDWLYA